MRGISDQHWQRHGFLFSSPALDRVDDEDHLCHPHEPPSPVMVDEEHLRVNSTPRSQLPCSQCVEADSETIPLLQVCSWGVLSEDLHDSESEWEDLEEPGDLADGDLRWVSCSQVPLLFGCMGCTGACFVCSCLPLS